MMRTLALLNAPKEVGKWIRKTDQKFVDAIGKRIFYWYD
jgi:hypothetical protein